ncbi:MAG TPA: ATP-binding protein [Candidatus Binatia bacterium]|nr:ATP-binding protein [Candidatus Binatia bacterium]
MTSAALNVNSASPSGPGNHFRLGEWKIGTLLTVCFATIVVLMVLGDIITLSQFNRVEQRASRFYQADQKSLAIMHVYLDVVTFRETLTSLAQDQNPGEFTSQATSLRDNFLKDVALAQQSLSSAQEASQDPTILNRVETVRSALPPQVDTMLELVKAGDWQAVRFRLAGQVPPLIGLSSSLVADVEKQVGEERAQALEGIQRAQRQLYVVLPLTGVVILIMAAMLGWYATHRISGPLAQLDAAAQALARGEFEYKVAVDGRDELADLGRAFNYAAEQLHKLYDVIKRSEAYLSEAQRLSHTGSFGWQVASGSVYWSAETFRIFEVEPEAQLHLDAVMQRVHPEDRWNVRQIIDSAAREKKDFDLEHRLLMPGGLVKHVRAVGHPSFKNESASLEFVGVITDITERKRAENALQRSQFYIKEGQRVARMGSWAYDPGGFFEYWSEELFQIYGLDPHKGAPTLEQYLAVIHPQDRESMAEVIKAMLLERCGCDVKKRILRSDGELRYIRCVGIPVVEADALKGFLGTAIDVTEQEQLEQERERLRQLEAELAHTNRVSMLGEMAASLAHELKQPLAAAITSANSCIEWLAHEPPNLERARAAAARIDKYGNRAAEIIDHIRSLYRKSPSQREPVNVNEIVHEIFPLLQSEASRYSIAMRLELADGLPRIEADRVQLQQVFMNLMLNAIEAMQDTGGELAVTSRLQEGQPLFAVSDTGMGLPEGIADQIFSAFFTTKPQGSGMGLAISRSIVESHGGRLWATANDGRGATFYFTLPAHPL